MNRLHKKCMIASGVTHGMLMVVLILGSAFTSSRKVEDDLPIMTFLDGRVVDQKLFGGGNPTIKPQPVASAPPVPTPPAPAPPVPRQNEPEPDPEPPKPVEKKREKKPTKVEKPEPVEKPSTKKPVEVAEKVEKPEPRRVQVSTNVVKLASARNQARAAREAQDRSERAERAEREAAAVAAQARVSAARDAIRGAARGISRDVSPGLALEAAGPGGEAFINYGQLVKSLYDRAWLISNDVADEHSAVRVKIEIYKDGSVRSARIVNPSGNPAVDKSVQRALNEVRFIAPFPEGARDSSRTFYINFNVKAKRQLG